MLHFLPVIVLHVIPLRLHLHTTDSYIYFYDIDYFYSKTTTKPKVAQYLCQGIIKSHDVEERHLPLKLNHFSLDQLRPSCFGLLHKQKILPRSEHLLEMPLLVTSNKGGEKQLDSRLAGLQLHTKLR